MKSVLIASLLIVTIGVLMRVERDAHALAKPMRSYHARKLSVSSTTAQNIPSLLSNEEIGMECAVSLYVLQSMTTQINVGGGDVDNSTKFIPLCGDAAACPATIIPMDVPASQVFLRRASGSGALAVYVLLGGGC